MPFATQWHRVREISLVQDHASTHSQHLLQVGIRSCNRGFNSPQPLSAEMTAGCCHDTMFCWMRKSLSPMALSEVAVCAHWPSGHDELHADR